MPQMKLFGNSRSAARVAGRRKAEPENEPKEKKQKKKKPLKVLAIWLTVILCLEGLYFFLCYTQNSFVKRWRTIYIQTAMSPCATSGWRRICCLSPSLTRFCRCAFRRQKLSVIRKAPGAPNLRRLRPQSLYSRK